MISEYSGVDRSGKTTLAVYDILNTWAVSKDIPHGFKPSDFYGNTAIFVKGYHHVESLDLMERMTYALDKKQQHIGFFLDEASSHIPARGFGDKEQRTLVKKIWQNEKLFQRWYIVSNTGNSIDTIINQAVHYTYLPRYSAEEDAVYFKVLFRRMLSENTYRITGVRNGVQQMFDSWLPVT